MNGIFVIAQDNGWRITRIEEGSVRHGPWSPRKDVSIAAAKTIALATGLKLFVEEQP